MRAHAITTKPPVGGRGRARRTIVPGVLALSLAWGLLAATASTASAQGSSLSTWYCPPLTRPASCYGPDLGPTTSFDFGDRQVRTTSPVQRFALAVRCYSNPCLETLNPSIGVSGDYAQTNDCPATLSAAAPGQGQRCIIEVTFTPAGTGPKAGTLSTGPGGPTLRLTGRGVTHATPPALPLLLSVGYRGYHQGLDPSSEPFLKRKLALSVHTNYDSRVVVSGGVTRTVAQSQPTRRTRLKANLKHLRRLKESPTEPTVKIKFAATDEFGQRVTDELKVPLCRRNWDAYTVICGRWSGHSQVPDKTTKVKTSVTLKYKADDPSDPFGGGSFSGQVTTRKGSSKGCQNRRVLLYADIKLKPHSGRTNDRGKYTIQWLGADEPGSFVQAVATEKRITKSNGDKVVCKGGRSKRLGVL